MAEVILGLGSVMSYPTQWPGAEEAMYPSKGYGLCDDEMWESRQGAEGWRFQQGLLKLTRTATNLDLAPGASLDFFGKGTGETGAPNYPATYVLTNSETDTNRDGALVNDEDENFFIYGLGFSVGRPFTMEQAVPTSPNREYYPWHEGYVKQIQEVIPDAMGITMLWPDTNATYDLGKLKFWQQHSTVVGASIPSIGNSGGFNTVTPVRRPLIGGYRTSKDKLSIRIGAGMGVRFINDVAFPTVGDLYVPITAIAYGVSQRKDRCIVCAPGSSQVDIEAMVDRKVALRMKQLGK